ncbi:hypothetical protein [Accumulibacter sp.]|uniref:hypothetical protein n=1 Tax=Accumulibacter sp. TaxID=2053492 RepID=UPI002BEE2987|nr:hypothetical protein [Accumulibacter sp.]HNB69429.1 hypothetical protein [Accumulibacter sp.]HNC21761.1 hypothetical protein [Accumulibacter sp.]
MDRIARECGYYTSSDVEMCVRSAEEEAMKSAIGAPHQDVTQDTAPDCMQSNPLPPGYIGYFVSYSHMLSGAGSGFGCMEIGRQQTIRSLGDVLSMTDLIKNTLQTRYGYRSPSVVVLNWQRFEAPAPDGAKEPVPDDAPQSVVLRLVA